MSTCIMSECWSMQIPLVAKAVLISLADNANDHGYCWPSISKICERVCCKKDAAIAAIAYLEKACIVTAHRENGRHTSYIIHPSRAIQINHESRREIYRHKSGKPTGRANPPVGQTDSTSRANRLDQSGKPTLTVMNRHEPSILSSCSQQHDQQDGILEPLVTHNQTPTCQHSEIVALYHELLPNCTHMRIWSGTRQKNLQARWRENAKHQNLDFWRSLFVYCQKSDFLMGRTQPTPGRTVFVMSLDWLVKPENFWKTIEGRYHRDDAA